jgi:hypothetical protein
MSSPALQWINYRSNLLKRGKLASGNPSDSTLKSSRLLLAQQLTGDANVSLFAADDRGGHAAKDATICR